MHLEFLVEDSSGATLIETLVQKLLANEAGEHTWRVHSYKGIGRIPPGLRPTSDSRKRILLDQLPKVLRGYAQTAGIDAVIVVVDSDRRDCAAFLSELRRMATDCNLPLNLFRIAIEEIEAWYLGDPVAIEKAYPRVRAKFIAQYVQDSVCGTWELLADAVYPGGRKAVQKVGWPLPGQIKHEWARQIGPHLSLDGNASPSFRKFCEGVRRIAGTSS
jgi:hypothetical protein